MIKFFLICLLALSTVQPSAQVQAQTTPLSDYGVYTLQCQGGSKFLQVAGDTLYNQKYVDGALLQQAGALPAGKNGSWQRWYLVYRAAAGKVRYYQVRNVFSGKLLTSPSNIAGVQLVQQGETAALSDQQLWQVDGTSTTAYRLLNKGNGLAVTNHNASTSDNTAITQEEARPDFLRQRWALAPQPVQSYRDDQATHFFERNDRSQGSVAFDGGASVLLRDGRVLWLTSDAFDGQSLVSSTSHLIKAKNYIAYRNTALLQPSVTAWSNTAPNVTNPANKSIWFGRQVLNAPKSVYPNGPFAWPYAGIEIGNHIYAWAGEGTISTQKVNGKTVTDTATVHRLGQTGQALYDLTEAAGTSWPNPVRIVPNGFAYSALPCGYSAGFVSSADGYVYTYGAKYNMGDNIYVARFKPNPDSVRSGWRYWNGKAWAAKPSKAKAAIIARGVSSSSVCYLNGRYVLVSQDVAWDCSGGRRLIFVSTSKSPTGPFATRVKVADMREYIYGKRARAYALHVHPEAVNGHNELLVTYSTIFYGTGDACHVAPPTGLDDTYFYRLKGMRIPYSLMGL